MDSLSYNLTLNLPTSSCFENSEVNFSFDYMCRLNPISFDILLSKACYYIQCNLVFCTSGVIKPRSVAPCRSVGLTELAHRYGSLSPHARALGMSHLRGGASSQRWTCHAHAGGVSYTFPCECDTPTALVRGAPPHSLLPPAGPWPQKCWGALHCTSSCCKLLVTEWVASKICSF